MVNTKLNWEKNWNSNLKLWRHYESQEPRDNSTMSNVHSSADAAMKLLVAAQTGCLNKIEVFPILTAIREIQVLDSGVAHGK